MYFANGEHEKNYRVLMDLYHLNPNQDVQYEANIYIAAYPEIFKCFGKVDTAAGPLYSLMKWDEEKEKHVFDAAGLTGSTTRLVEIGLSLYNGYDVRLDDVFGSIASEELFNVFIQACRIRARK